MLNASLSLKTGEYQVQVKTECLMKRESLEQQLCLMKGFSKQHSGDNYVSVFSFCNMV